MDIKTGEKKRGLKSILQSLTFIKFFSGFKSDASYKIVKDNRERQTMTIEKFPRQLLKRSDVEFSLEHIESYFASLIMTFEREIRTSIRGVNLTALYENTQNLSIIEMKNKKETESLSASFTYYYDGGCEILVFEDYVFESIFHELLHLSSTRSNNFVIFCGFSQESVKDGHSIIGDGLNEGYTSLLAQRYFAKHGESGADYRDLQYISEAIEILVGRNVMEKLYFDSNLTGLVNKMKNYMSKDDIYTIIREMDDLFLFRKVKSRLFTEQQRTEAFISILMILSKSAKRKLSLLGDEDIEEKEGCLDLISDIKSKMDIYESDKLQNKVKNVFKMRKI